MARIAKKQFPPFYFYLKHTTVLAKTAMEVRIPGQWINAEGTETKNIKNNLLPMPVLRTCR